MLNSDIIPFYRKENYDTDVLSLGLSSSDINYLNRENDQLQMSDETLQENVQPNDAVNDEEANIRESNSAFNIIQTNPTAAYSGELFQTAGTFNQQAACSEKLQNQNHFVQVTSNGSIGLISDPTLQTELVSNNSNNVNYTQGTPLATDQQVQFITINNTLTDSGVKGFPLSLDNVPISILPQPVINDAVQVTTHQTETPVTYLITMSVDSPNKSKELNTQSDVIPLEEPQPQRTSTPTPKMQEDHLGRFDETIIAGNLNNTPVDIEDNSLKQKSAGADKIPVREMYVEQKNVVADENKHQSEEKEMNGKTKRPEITSNHCKRKLKLVQIDNLPSQNEQEKIHNTTYCRDWVQKVNDPNASLAQSDHSVEKTSFDFSSLNITSVSNNKPELKFETQEKFVSQRHKREITQLPKKNPDTPKM